jgi:hypothetical protein
MTHWTRCAAAFVAGSLMGVLPASSEATCDEWFPDLFCDRSGRFEGFEQPIVQPYLFEDPFITTGLYPYYIWHDFPEDSAFEGGSAHVAAAQIRLAITDRFAFIATKDGYMWKRPDNPLLEDTGGFMNLGFGAKYAIYQDRDAGRIVSLVLRYEAPSGASDAYQDGGSGMLMPSVTGAVRLGDLALQGDFGGIWAADSSQSSSIFYHLYAAYPVAPWLTPFVQISGINWVESGDGSREIPLANGSGIPISVVESLYGPFEGADVANLGSVDVEGLDLITAAVGLHASVSESVTVSVAYEHSISGHEGIFQQRVTTSVALEF